MKEIMRDARPSRAARAARAFRGTLCVRSGVRLLLEKVPRPGSRRAEVPIREEAFASPRLGTVFPDFRDRSAPREAAREGGGI